MIDPNMENIDAPFTFRAVQVFVAIVEAQSVTRAAHRLGISPSSASQQLASLEAALGAKLIERTARQFRVTTSGNLFLEPAKKLLDDVGAAKAKLVIADQSPPIALRIASIEELDASVTAPWLVRLKSVFPNITLTLTSGASHENLDALSGRAIDMMIAVDTVGDADWVEQHPLLRDPFIMVQSKKLTDYQTPSSLKNVPFLRYANHLQIGRQIEAQLRRTGQTPPRGYEFTTNQALFAMTAEIGGWAITTALAFLGTPLARERLTPAPLPIPLFSRRLSLQSRAGNLHALPEHMADEMRDCIAQRLISQADEQLAFAKDELQIIH